MAGAARPAGWHRPIDFPSWAITCADLAAAIAEGPGLVVLVGPAGSGKSMTVAALAARLPDRSMKLRRADRAIRPGTTVDVIDPVIDALLDDLVRPAAATVRVLAARPDQLQPILDRAPGVRVVRVRPLTSRDRRAFIQARRTQRRRAADARMNRAMAGLIGYDVTTPGALDRMIDQIFELVPAKLWPDRAEEASLFESLLSAHERWLEPDAATHSAAGADAMGATVRGPLARSGRLAAAFGDGRHLAPSATDPDGGPVQAGPGFPERRGQTFEAPSWEMMQSSGHEIAHDGLAGRRWAVPAIAASATVVLLAGGGIAANRLWTNPAAEQPGHLASEATPLRFADLSTPGAASIPVATPPPAALVPPASVEHQVAANPLGAQAEHPDASPALAREAPVVEAHPVIAAAPAPSAPALAPPPVAVASAGLASAAPASTEPSSAAPASAAPPQLGRGPAAPQAAPNAAAPQAAPDAAAAALPPPPSRTPGPQQPAPVLTMGEDAVHLLRLGKALMSIGQQADGERLLAASAELGNAEAEALLSGRSHARSTRSASRRLHNAR